MAITTKAVGKIDEAGIAGLKGPQLVALYNELNPEKTVKKFADRTTAVKRVVIAFRAAKVRGAGKATGAKGAAKAPKAARSSEEGSSRTYRPESKRGKVIDMASADGGAAVSDLLKATKWKRAELLAALARIQSYNGLTVTREGEGDDEKVTITGTLLTRKPFEFQPKDSVKECKPGSKRATVLDMLLSKTGATFEEIQKATKWDDRTAYEGIRLIHGYVGYGLRQDEEGRIHAYTK